MLRAIMICALATRCDGGDGRSAGPPAAVTGVHVETSEGASSGPDQSRLDLGAWEPWTTGEGTGEPSTGAPAVPTTSGTSTGTDESTSGGTSTGEDPGTSTGAASTGGTTGGSSTGDDTSTGELVTDCPCQDGADNVCDLAPGTCSATMPGGYCDPDADGAYFDGDWTLGAQEYTQKCG